MHFRSFSRKRNINTLVTVTVKWNKWSLNDKPRRNVCLRHCRLFCLSWPWPWPLTSDLENVFINDHSHDEYLWKVSSKVLRQVKSYRVTVNGQTTDGRTDEKTTGNTMPPLPVVGRNKKTTTVWDQRSKWAAIRKALREVSVPCDEKDSSKRNSRCFKPEAKTEGVTIGYVYAYNNHKITLAATGSAYASWLSYTF